MRLTTTSAGLIGRDQAAVVVHDSDVPRLSSAPATVETEGDSGPQPWTATLSLPSPPEKDTLVPIRTGGTARRGSDYTLSATSLLWPAGQQSVPFPWQGLGDVLTEEEETVTISSERPVMRHCRPVQTPRGFRSQLSQAARGGLAFHLPRSPPEQAPDPPVPRGRVRSCGQRAGV